MAVMTNKELVAKCLDIAKNYKTLYVMGCFGAPMTAKNKTRYTSNYDYNKGTDRTKMIQNASEDTFGFDCVCLIKGILWGWNGNKSHVYGGAAYKANGVPDIGANAIINVCTDISTDFSKIEIGELVWMNGHVGIYVGDGLAVECSPKWANNVQITACNKSVSGYNRRNWTKHGKLPYIEYEAASVEVANNPDITYNIQITQKLSQGMMGIEVKKLQMRVAQISPEFEAEVKSHSSKSNGEFDGSFGPAMVKTIRKLQVQAGLAETGIVDDATMKLLNSNILDLNKKIVDAKKILK